MITRIELPQTIINWKPTQTTTQTSAVFQFSSNKPGTFKCKLDNGIFETCTTPKTYTNLTQTWHTFTVKAIDTTWNEDSTPEVYSWMITRIELPQTIINWKPTQTTTQTSATFQFWSNKAGTFKCKLDNGIFETCTTPKSYTNLTQTWHTFTVKAIDQAWNEDSTPEVYSWIITRIDPAPAPTPTPTPTPTPISDYCSDLYKKICWVKYIKLCNQSWIIGCTEQPVYKTYLSECELKNNKGKFIFYNYWDCEDINNKDTNNKNVNMSTELKTKIDLILNKLIKKIILKNKNKEDKIKYFKQIIIKIEKLKIKNHNDKKKYIIQYILDRLNKYTK